MQRQRRKGGPNQYGQSLQLQGSHDHNQNHSLGINPQLLMVHQESQEQISCHQIEMQKFRILSKQLEMPSNTISTI